MGKLRIESLAQALGKDPLTLTSIELRKLCILIDWTMALETAQPGESVTTPLLSDNISLTDLRAAYLSMSLVSAIKNDGFLELNELKPDYELMDDMLQRLGMHLGYTQKTIDIIREGAGFIRDYEDQIQNQGLVYTDYLYYKKQLSPNDLNTINQFFSDFARHYPWLSNQSLAGYNQNTFAIELNPQLVIPNDVTHANKISFILELLRNLAVFEKNYRYKVSEVSLQFLSTLLNQFVSEAVRESSSPSSFKIIATSLSTLINQSKNWCIKNDLCGLLAHLLTRQPTLRGWKTLALCKPDQPVHRVILMGYEDVADDEVTLTVDVMLKNHPNENIVITYTPDDVIKANFHNQQLGNIPFTLQTIGHGTQQSNGEFTANLGSFRGNAVSTGKAVAQLVNECSNIHHVRLSCCFSGQVDPQNMYTVAMIEKQRPADAEARQARKTFTLVNSGTLTQENSPFAMNTAAISCWNAIQSKDRKISMTVSPGIIEPDEELSLMIWKLSIDDHAIGVKEIRVTTENGPKFLPAWQHHQTQQPSHEKPTALPQLKQAYHL